ncbi:MAG: DUF4147 domain-containing protein [Acidobacteria bacterium]|nr:DUF4147 domain-containing protein [Acidobacteriota bacterium]
MKEKERPRGAAAATRHLRRHAVQIFQAAVKAVDGGRLVRSAMELDGDWLRIGTGRLPVVSPGHVHVFGAGKAAAAMALAVERTLGARVAGGVVVTKRGHGVALRRVRLLFGSHPQPTQASLRATRRLVHGLQGVMPGDSVLFLWSGGASALLLQPREGISFDEKVQALAMLMDAGADIRELNTVRKHLSAVKGGQLARLLPRVPAASLLLSDVCGDDPATIGSGPTVADDTTFGEAVAVLKRHWLWKKCPSRVRALLEAGASGVISENPGPGDPVFRRKKALVIGTSHSAISAAAERARSLGYRTLVVAQQLQGETVAAARLYASVAAASLGRRPLCLLSGGETTLRLVPAHGRGGRNQHFTLAAALLLAASKGMRDLPYVVCSCGTDGTDGPTDAAGALADNTTLARALAAGLNAEEFLRRQDSHTYFKKIGGLVVTGPTRTNVMDLRLLLIGRGQRKA